MGASKEVDFERLENHVEIDTFSCTKRASTHLEFNLCPVDAMQLHIVDWSLANLSNFLKRNNCLIKDLKIH